ncbi:TRAP transporter substrate-binding protein [Marinobacterium aestuariivivens]|uniref:TRAP transporter substrate-binding protein n=1 Tax=Marinobacterium aestuariivivens TaxID=1698799 RepID=A0ABW2A5I1_9GAMM
MLKKITSSIAILGVSIAFSFNAKATSEVNVPYVKETVKTLKLAHGLPTGSPYDKGAERFSELVEIYSRGEVKVQIYPGGQLGNEVDVAKDVQLGTLDLGLVAINNSSKWYKPLDIFIMPFIFRDREHANAVIEGPVGKELFDNYRKASGMSIVSVFEWGDRAIFNNKRAINHPDDLKGVKVRVPKNKVMIDTYNAFGANATAIAWGELYSALQQGVADGLEGPPQGMIDMKFNDFLDYYSYINVYYGTSVVLMNDKTLQGLSPENQAAIIRAGQEAGVYQRWLSTVSHLSGLSKLKDLGVNVNVVSDRQAFVDKVQPVWDKYRTIIGEEWFDKVSQAK